MAAVVNKKKFLFSILIGLLFLLGAGFLSSIAEKVQAQTADLHGWAWSSNIGWLSFNSADTNSAVTYKVSLNENNQLVGDAWSSNIGWVHFDPTYTGPVGQGDNWGAKISGIALTGWARACAVFADGCSGNLRSADENGGWDGWIKMTNVSYNSSNGGLSGFAWGDLNLGWLSFAIFGSSDGGGGDGECDPLVQVCAGPGGGPLIVCSVEPTSGDTTQPFLFTASGGESNSTYVWSSDGGFGTYGQPSSEISSFQTIFQTAGFYHLAVSVDGREPVKCNGDVGVRVSEACLPDGSAVPDPASGLVCCNPDPSDETDGICGPPVQCEISFVSPYNSISYYKKAIQPLNAPKIKIDINACTGDNLTLVENNLDHNFELVCSQSQTTDFGSCVGLTSGRSYWVSVRPLVDPLPGESITELFDLALTYSSGETTKTTDPLLALFKYIVSGTN